MVEITSSELMFVNCCSLEPMLNKASCIFLIEYLPKTKVAYNNMHRQILGHNSWDSDIKNVY